ncbi:leucine-, glutamate- and lysine-rich protein 1 isoform X3 [Hippoglossus hippoglossus]|uniref:leucine-, glutamate- and lysine-rich protein 1 isoform X3 n=1 Tax=Hippoglossus hippoglossus TaxID=8267 RepID=UPI00148B5FA8|nr:leucine-, glutamate- and lysine-rich protein 1 isoform X3 [Hippoglossus hippoglossus]
MGDKERMMEEEKEGNFTMVHHCPPMYPLPEEIKKMDRSETVCRYCGVSYLIYHEFHQLNTRLAQLETELQELREAAQREKAQREALELSRLEWETALNLEVQRKAEERETSMKEELEEKRRDTERLLREDNDRRGREMEEDYEKISEEKEKKLRGELGDLEVERLRRQREELERRNEEREKVLSDALHKANTNLDELRKYLQQVEERLAVAASRKKEAEQLLKKETRQGEILRGVCVQQVKALRATLIVLLSSASELTDIRGFLSQLTGAWQAFKSQILQHSTQVLSVLKEELKHSSEELQKTTEAREKLTQQLMQQRRQSEEQLSQQQDSEKEHRGRILRLKDELEAKHERWLSCQQRCDTIQEQLSSWQQRQEETKRKYCAAEEEVARLREALEKDQQETRELRKERDILIDSHGRTLEKMEDDCRQQLASKLAATLGEQRTQSALQLREQMEEFRREVELEMTIDREKNRLLLLHYQRDSTQLQQKVALLQETVRRECQEREELTAALSAAQVELLGLRSPSSHQASTRSPPNPTERHAPPGNKHFHLQSQGRAPLTRSSTSPNTLRPSPARTDKGRGSTDGGGAGKSVESWNGGGLSGEEKQQEGTLPRLKASSTVREGKRKVPSVMWRKERQ